MAQYKTTHIQRFLPPRGYADGHQWFPLEHQQFAYRDRSQPFGVRSYSDELERVRAMGADNYIQEQLAPESINENLSIDVVKTNGGWQYVTATGNGSSSTLYIYLTRAGEGYIDDIKLVAGAVPEVGVNLIRQWGF